MAKPATPVDRSLLEQSLKEAEKNGPLKNLNALWKAAATIYNRTSKTKITHSIVSLRVRDWRIQVQTVPGKRGKSTMSAEHKAALQASRGNRKPRSEKMKEFSGTFKAMRRRFKKDPSLLRFLPIVDSAEKGSLTAAIKLQCLDCSDYQTQEIKQCHIQSCPLYPHRPYKPTSQAGDEVELAKAS